MKCSKAEILISAQLDGELTVSEWREVEQHIATCARCHRTFEAFGRSTEAYREMPRREPSPEQWPRLAARIRQMESQASSRPSPSVWLQRALDIRSNVTFNMRAALLTAIFAALLIFAIMRRENTAQNELAWVPQGGQLESEFFEGPLPESRQTTNSEIPAGFSEDLQHYFERVGVLLSEVKNGEVADGEQEVQMLREESRGLLEETVLIREGLRETDLAMLKETVGTLEVVLLDLANLQQTHAADEIDMLRTEIAQNNLLIRMQIIDLHKILEQSFGPAPGRSRKAADTLPKI